MEDQDPLLDETLSTGSVVLGSQRLQNSHDTERGVPLVQESKSKTNDTDSGDFLVQEPKLSPKDTESLSPPLAQEDPKPSKNKKTKEKHSNEKKKQKKKKKESSAEPTKKKKKKKKKKEHKDKHQRKTVAITKSAQKDRENMIYVDFIVIEARGLKIESSSGWLFGGGVAIAPYCVVELDGSVQKFCTATASERNPVWNNSLTFTYKRARPMAGSYPPRPYVMTTTSAESVSSSSSSGSFVEVAVLSAPRLFVTMRNKGGKLLSKDVVLGRAELVLEMYEDETVHDLWIDLKPPLDRVTLGHLLDPAAETPAGKVHVILQKTTKPDAGLLSYFGAPLRSIPLRLEAGDIILINNSEFYRHTIKIATGSEWDHIAMIVRRRGTDALMLFEATVEGVDVFRLDLRLDFYRETAKLGIRRLQLPRTPEMIDALTLFVEETIGKPYSSLMNILRAYNGTALTNDSSSFFCSQLIAEAYQRMGLLGKDIPSNMFLPVDFVDPDGTGGGGSGEAAGGQPLPPKLQLLHGRLGDILLIPRKMPEPAEL